MMHVYEYEEQIQRLHRQSLTLVQGSVIYRDKRLDGVDATAVIELGLRNYTSDLRGFTVLKFAGVRP